MIANFRNNLLFINFCLLLLLNYGYMQIRFPQARIGVPVSEWLLLLMLFTASHLRMLRGIRDPILWFPYLFWVGYGSIIILLSYFEHGIRAVRDGLPVIEALFLYAGLIFAREKRSLALLETWLPRLLIASAVYAALFPLGESIRNLSPVVRGIQDQEVPLFVHFTTSNALLVVGAAYSLERFRQTTAWRYILYSAAALALSLAFIPSRTLLLLIAMLVLYFAISGGVRGLLGIAAAIGIGLMGSLALLSLGIEDTRLGLSSFSDYSRLFFEIFPGFESAEDPLSSGTADRLRWWSNIYEQLVASWSHLTYGLGYGIPLTDLETGAERVQVYTPHNTLVSVIARGGLIAGATFLWMHSVLVERAIKVVQKLRTARRDGAIPVALLFILLCTLLTGIGEEPFVMPYLAVPYYFSAGILLRMYYDWDAHPIRSQLSDPGSYEPKSYRRASP